MTFVATFYSHFGAIRYKKMCQQQGVQAETMPVPRDLSSSCGTCVRGVGEPVMPEGVAKEEMEQLVEALEQGGYRLIYRAEES